MERTVTVKGTGKLKLSPDTIEISMFNYHNVFISH